MGLGGWCMKAEGRRTVSAWAIAATDLRPDEWNPSPAPQVLPKRSVDQGQWGAAERQRRTAASVITPTLKGDYRTAHPLFERPDVKYISCLT